MANLGKAVRNQLGALLANAGFEKDDSPLGSCTLYSCITDETKWYLAFDRMKGGTIRLFLSTDVLPNIFPPQITGQRPIYAEGPWYEMIDIDETEAAVESSGQFLTDFGFSWFEDPYRLTPTEWRELANLLVHDLTFVTPVLILPSTRDPKSIVRIRKAVRALEDESLIELKERLDGLEEFEMGRTELADAIELQATAQRQELKLELRDRKIAR